MLSNKYSRDLDVLVALISNLSVGKKSQRTPHGLSIDLSIREDEIKRVLDSYKSLFREAIKPKSEGKQKPYSLQLRYALQYEEGDEEIVIKPPLPNEHVTALISFVSDMAKDEKAWNIQLIASFIAAAVAIIAAIFALVGG